MKQNASTLAAAALCIPMVIGAHSAEAQKSGGTLRVYHRDSPASMSIHEEGTVGVIMPMMGVFNNLMLYDQHIAKNSVETIVPELATGWTWNADDTALTVTLRDGVRWHDGKPFTARDVKCTFDLLSNQGKEKLRLNYRESWWDTVPLLADVKAQAPKAICQIAPTSEAVGVLINRTVPPFDSPEVRLAIALTLDRKSFIDILGQGEGNIGGAMQPPPEGSWGLSPEMLADLPGYGGDVQANRDKARAIMQRLGYGPDKRIPLKVSVRNLAVYRDPGNLLIDQIREIYFDGELELTETATWVPKLIRKDYKLALNVLGAAVDDPDVVLFQNHVCNSVRKHTGHCNKDLDLKINQQSMERDPIKRKLLVQEIDRTLQEELARPILYHRRAATCWQPEVKGLTLMVNSQYNGWRMEDVWLDR